MPIFCLETNIPRGKIRSDFVLTLLKVVAQTLDKLEAKCAVNVVPDQIISFGGSCEPCAIGYLKSIGGIGPEENKRISFCLFEYISRELPIPKERMYIHYINIAATDLGHQGTTVQVIRDQEAEK